MLRNHLNHQLFTLFFIFTIFLGKPAFVQASSPTSAATIDAYLQSYNSPMVGSGDAYMRWGQYFNVDPRLIVAISSAESSLGKNAAGFNAWGWFLNGHIWTSFAAGIDTDTNTNTFSNAPNFVAGQGINMGTGWEDGIFWVTHTIQAGYFPKGLTTVDAIAPVYCTSGTANWIKNVKISLSELGGDPNQLTFTSASVANRPVLVPGNQWLGGQGVDAYDNGTDFNKVWGNSYVGSTYVGLAYQCVELPQRLYTIRGWHNGSFNANAVDIFGAANRLGMEAYSNGSGHVPVPGDMVVLQCPGTVGHVAVVDTVDNNNVNVVEQNWPWSHDRHSFARSGNNGSFLANRGSYTVVGIVHSPNNHNTNGGSPDTTPPIVTITSGHVNGGTYFTQPQYVTWSIDDGSGSGIDQWKQAWDSDPGDGAIDPNNPGAGPYSTNSGNLSLPVGTHTLNIHVRDKAGNEKNWTFGPYTLNPDTTPPTVTITSGQTSGATYNTPQNLTWSISDDASGLKSWGQGWDSDPGDTTYTTTTGNLNLPAGTHTLHIHVVDNAGNDKDWTFGPYTYTPQAQVGQNSDGTIDQRFVDCYNRVGPSIIGSVLNNNYVHTALGNGNGNGLAQDFIDGNSAQNIIIAKDGATKAYDVRGNLWTWYSALNYADSPAGFPNGDMQIITIATAGTVGFDAPGAVQTFEGGWVYDSTYGTHLIPQSIMSGLSLATIVRVINGTFGFPTTDFAACGPSPQGTVGQQGIFEHGGLYSRTNGVGTHGVSGAIFDKYAAAETTSGKYGFPISDPYAYQGGTKQDFEGGSLTDGTTTSTHILWNNTNGAASLWNYNPSTGGFTQNTYGSFAGWTAKAIADGGTDGNTRMLWNNANGTAALWNVTSSTGSFTSTNFGPYSGWTANAVSVASDNTTHLLWTNTSGKAALWNVVNGQYQSEHDFGPYAGWTAKALADGGTDGKTRLLWTNTNGQAAFWNVSSATGAFSQFSYGPYAGWAAKGVSVSSTTTHILWSNTNGTQSVWNYNPANGTFSTANYGPYSGWSANAVADGSDGKVRLLWDNTSGQASFWSLDNATGLFGAFSFGPYGGWTAIAISGGN